MQMKVNGPGRSASTSRARATCAGLRSSLPTGWCRQLTASSTTEDSGGPLGGMGSLCFLGSESPLCVSHARVVGAGTGPGPEGGQTPQDGD